MTIIVISPILLFIAAFECVGSLTLNNILNGIHKIPFIGPFVSGTIALGVAMVIAAIGIWFWINYLFIMLRCLGGPNV